MSETPAASAAPEGVAGTGAGLPSGLRGLAYLHDAVVILDAGSRIIYWNPVAERLYGWTLAEVLGRRVAEILGAGWIRPEDDAARRACLERDGLWRGEAVHGSRDGTRVVVEISMAVFRNEQGEAAGSLAVIRDLTPQVREEEALRERELRSQAGLEAVVRERTLEIERANQALRESEARFRALVEEIPAITYIAALDEASTTQYVSPQVTSLLGYSPEDYRADADIWRKLLHPDDRERVMAELHRVQAAGGYFVAEYRMLGRGNRVIWFRDSARVVRDARNQRVCLEGVMLDITERKRAEEALRASDERNRRLERAIAEAREREQQRIGQELHDRLGQQLTGMALLSSALQKKLARKRSAAAAEAAQIAGLAATAVSLTRDLARSLQPVEVTTAADSLPPRRPTRGWGCRSCVTARRAWGLR